MKKREKYLISDKFKLNEAFSSKNSQAPLCYKLILILYTYICMLVIKLQKLKVRKSTVIVFFLNPRC